MDRRDRDFHGNAPQGSPVPQKAPARASDDSELDRYLATTVLQPGERIVWRGRPSPRAAIRGRVALNTAGTLPFLAVVAFMSVGAGFGPQTLFYAVLFGLGLWQLSRPWRFYRGAGRSTYLVTDRQVLIVQTKDGGFSAHAMTPERIRDVVLHSFRDGKGQVFFSLSRVGRLQVRYDRVGFLDGFWGVEDPGGAMRAVQGLLGGAARG